MVRLNGQRCVCPAVMSNEELYDRMRQQRMLREELRDKKKELEDMMRKEHSLKQNSRNQDTQSDVISYSNKSDQFGLVFAYFYYSINLFITMTKSALSKL